jgi:tRNA pseudouridine13 synthase
MPQTNSLDLSLPYITPSIIGIGGVIRTRPDLFRVEELPAYEPIGYGDHIYVNITKQEKTTRETQIELARLFNLHREDVGHAGLKDKHAISTQTFSLLMPKDDPEEVKSLIESNLGFTLNWVKRHPKKLRSGHLKGNKFKITVTELDISPEEALTRATNLNEIIKKRGIPNYFGVQRTGNDGKNVVNGFDLITGKYRENNRWLRRFLISSYLSHLCNRYLAERVRRNLFTSLLPGDLAKKHDTGGVFTVEDTAVEQTRFENGEISFTAPIYGYKMREAKNESKEFEDKIFSEAGVSMEQLKKAGVEGTRRLGRLLPIITITKHIEGLTFSFSLPAGGYATVVLREFMKNEEAPSEPEPIDADEEDATPY